MPGPSPEPVELRALKGNPGKRAMPKNAPQPERPSNVPPVPSYLKAAGRAAWSAYWRDGRAWLTRVDVPGVARLCRLIDRADEMERAIDSEGLLHESEKTGRSSAHYLVNQVIALYKTIGELEFDHGFRPAGRARLVVEKPKDDAVGEWESTG